MGRQFIQFLLAVLHSKFVLEWILGCTWRGPRRYSRIYDRCSACLLDWHQEDAGVLICTGVDRWDYHTHVQPPAPRPVGIPCSVFLNTTGLHQFIHRMLRGQQRSIPSYCSHKRYGYLLSPSKARQRHSQFLLPDGAAQADDNFLGAFHNRNAVSTSNQAHRHDSNTDEEIIRYVS